MPGPGTRDSDSDSEAHCDGPGWAPAPATRRRATVPSRRRWFSLVRLTDLVSQPPEARPGLTQSLGQRPPRLAVPGPEHDGAARSAAAVTTRVQHDSLESQPP